MSRKSKKRATKAKPKPVTPKPVPVGYGVFLEHENDYMEPVLIRCCANEYEAIGYRWSWSVDQDDFFPVKLVERPIDADGKPIDEEGGDE